MKKSNKGFSLVELIIVIAIMAILAGALAPALMKYINKTRLASDISAGQTVAKAIQAAMSNEAAFNEMDASFTCSYTSSAIMTHGKASFTSECQSVCDFDKAKPKAKKDMNGDSLNDRVFTVTVNVPSNSIEVSMSGKQVYPTPDQCLSAKTK